jgi:chromosome partitioning protein
MRGKAVSAATGGGVTARVFTIAQQKGGAGKTTLAAHLAVAWIGQGRRVAVIDIDPQASLSRWVEMRRASRQGQNLGFTFSQISGWRLAAEAERLAREHDAVLIDSPPHAETEARIAVRAASLVVVPVQPSPMDLWATRPTLELAQSERRPAILVVNRMPSRGRLATEMIDKLATLGIGVAHSTLGNRVAYAESLAEGLGVCESEPSSAAALEITVLGQELWDRAGG